MKQKNNHLALLDNIGEALIDADPTEPLAEKSLLVEYIPAELIRPDPVQPRRVLPEAIHFAFHSDRLTPSQALRELIQFAQVVARQNARPFTSVTDYLTDLDSDSESEPVKLSPEEQLLRELVTLALTIRDDGQVNPLTVVDATQGVTHLYRIETGERRYWATWLLRDFIPGYSGDGMVPCIVIPSGRASVFRQAKENTARAGLSAIAMARQAALLILAVHGIEKPTGPVNNDFYRQALELDLRDKREYTADILTAMGGLHKARLYHFKILLRLSDEAIELADRFNLDEGRLRHVLNLHADDHGEMVRQIIRFNLTAKQVKEMCEHDKPNTQPGKIISPELKKFTRLLRDEHMPSPNQLAVALLEQEKDVLIARARLQRFQELLIEVERQLPQK